MALNLKRHHRNLKIVLVDDPKVRELRYKEIGKAKDFLKEIGRQPFQDQIRILRSRYATYSTAYQEMDRYQEMLVHLDSALLEIPLEMAEFTESREEYIAEIIKASKPDVVLLRLTHCLTNPPVSLKSLGLTPSTSLPVRLGLSKRGIIRLSEAEKLVEPLSERD